MAALVHEHLHHLFLTVDISIGTIAVVGQVLHPAVLEVAHAEAHDAQVDTLVLIALHHLHQFLGGGDAHVEVAVGAHDDAVVAAGDIMGRCFLVSHLHRLPARGAAACLQAANDILDDLSPLGDKGGFQEFAYGTGVSDDGDTVLRAHVIHHTAQAGFYQFQSIIPVHGAGRVDEEDVVSGWNLAFLQGFTFEAQAQELV